MDKLPYSYLSVMLLMLSDMHSFRGSSPYIVAKTQYFLPLVENSNWLSSITKKGRLKVHLGPLVGFG
jgi:hypothetical protein